MNVHKSGLLSLHGLRGLAALLVVVFHFTTGSPFPNVVHEGILTGGTEAVLLFFIMSGFIMSHVYGAAIRERTFSGKAFLWKRVARLYPLHLATLAVLVALFVVEGRDIAMTGRYSWTALAANLGQLQAIVLDYRSWNYPAWSISVEWACYIAFPWIAAFIYRCGPRYALFLAVGLLWATAQVQAHSEMFVHNGVVFTGIMLFSLGVLAERIVERGEVRLPSAVYLGGATLLYLHLELPTGGIAPLLFLLVLSLFMKETVVHKAFNTAPMQWLGERSYSIYMWHAVVEYFSVRVISHFSIDVAGYSFGQSIAGVALLVFAVFVCSEISYRALEMPARKALHRGLNLNRIHQAGG